MNSISDLAHTIQLILLAVVGAVYLAYTEQLILVAVVL